MKDIMLSLDKLAISQEQDKIFSKVVGRENYIITLYDNKVIFYGTKKQWIERRLYICFLSDAYHYNHLKFTYKKDWIDALKKLGVEL